MLQPFSFSIYTQWQNIFQKYSSQNESLWVNWLFYHSNTSGDPEDQKVKTLQHFLQFVNCPSKTRASRTFQFWLKQKETTWLCWSRGLLWGLNIFREKVQNASDVWTQCVQWEHVLADSQLISAICCHEHMSAQSGPAGGDPEGTDPSGGLWQWRLKWKTCGQTSQTAMWFSSFRASMRSVRKYGWSTNWARWRFICSGNKPMMSSWSSTLRQREPNESRAIRRSIHETTYWHQPVNQ